MYYVKALKEEVKKECKKLTIPIPRFVGIKNSRSYMQAEFYYSLYGNTILQVESTNEVKVNTEKMDKLRNELYELTHDKDIKYDVTMAVLRHELRHIYQHIYDSCIVGCEDNEQSRIIWENDADEWMMKSAPSKREALLAEYINVRTRKTSKRRFKQLEEELKKAYAPGIKGWLYNKLA